MTVSAAIARAPRVTLIVAVGDVAERRAAIAAALAGGVDAIQLRDRSASGAALFDAARALRDLTRTHGAALLVNERIDVALAAAADGVHLPAASFPIAAARRLLGPAPWIGRSTHAPAEAEAAADAGADYVVLGPIFATPSKAAFGSPLGVAALAATRASRPVVAIGGVTVDRAAELRQAGAYGVAVIRSLLDSPDPAATAAAFRKAFD